MTHLLEDVFVIDRAVGFVVYQSLADAGNGSYHERLHYYQLLFNGFISLRVHEITPL